MKYILIFVCWTALQGGSPATAEFDDADACQRVANALHDKLGKTERPSLWYVHCWPKGSIKE